MNLQDIRTLFKDRKGKPMGILENYSVLLPLIYVDNELHILYQVRALTLDTQPGEVSFPGGMVEKNESFKEAAVRETWEELGIDKERIKVIGELDYMLTPYNFIIYPYVGILEGVNLDDINFNKAEVEKLFSVPLKYFLENEPLGYHIKLKTEPGEDFPYHMIQGGKNYPWRRGKYSVYFYKYENHIIWGMTARITKNFIDILNSKTTI